MAGRLNSKEDEKMATARYLLALEAYEDLAKLMGWVYWEGKQWKHLIGGRTLAEFFLGRRYSKENDGMFEVRIESDEYLAYLEGRRAKR